LGESIFESKDDDDDIASLEVGSLESSTYEIASLFLILKFSFF